MAKQFIQIVKDDSVLLSFQTDQKDISELVGKIKAFTNNVFISEDIKITVTQESHGNIIKKELV